MRTSANSREMKYCKKILGWLVLIIAGYTGAQGQSLTVGDSLPDYTFQNVLRYRDTSLRLHDFRGKVLILDLWRTTCSHAVASFAHFDSLRAVFPGQVEALGITTEDRNQITQYLTNNRFASGTKLPVVTNDTVLAGKRFSFIYIPHVVVVDTRGRIAAITAPEQVTPDVIRNLLSGEPVKLPLKKELTDFNYEVPVLSEGNGRNVDSLVYTSTVTHRLPGVLSTDSYDTSGNRLIYKAYNESIPELYAKVYHQLFDKNKVILDVKDSSRFTNANYDDEAWQNRNLWCYNLVLPPGYAHPDAFAVADLDRFFGIRGTLEKRRIKCFILIKKGKSERWRTKDPDSESYDQSEGGVRTLHNIPLPYLALNYNFTSPVLIIDGTGNYSEKADIRLRSTSGNLTALRKELNQYDLDLLPSVKKMNVVVIRENRR